MGGGTHSFDFSSYEGAVRRAKRANKNIRKTSAGVFLIFSFRPPTAVSDCARGGATLQGCLKHRARLLRRTRAGFSAGVLGSLPHRSCAEVGLTRRSGLSPPRMAPDMPRAIYPPASALCLLLRRLKVAQNFQNLLTFSQKYATLYLDCYAVRHMRQKVPDFVIK